MSNKAITWAWDQQLPPREKLILICLADAANDEDWQCWPSQRHVAAKTGYSIATVKRSLRTLDETGYLTRDHRRRADGSRSSDVYTLNTTRVQPDTTPAQADTTPAQPDTGGWYQADLPPRSPMTYQEPSNEPSLEPKGNHSGDASAAPSAQAIIGAWLDTLSARPPGRVIGHLAKEVKALLDEGQDHEQVTAAVHEWNRRGLHPSTLPSVLHGLRNEQPRWQTRDDRIRATTVARHQQLADYTPAPDPFEVAANTRKEVAS